MKCELKAHADCMQEAGPLGSLSGHVIICGAEGSFVNFVEQLRRCDPMPTPVVVLHPRRPSAAWSALKALGPVHFVAGEFSAFDGITACHCCQSQRPLPLLSFILGSPQQREVTFKALGPAYFLAGVYVLSERLCCIAISSRQLGPATLAACNLGFHLGSGVCPH